MIDHVKRLLPVFLLFVAVFSGYLILPGCHSRSEQTSNECEADSDSIGKIYMLDICIDTLIMEDYQIRRGENLSVLLANQGVSAGFIDSVSNKAKSVFDLTKFRAGQQYTLLKDTSMTKLCYFIYRNSLTEYVVFDLRDTIRVYNYHKEIKNRPKIARGTIESSLWNTMNQSGADPLLALHLSDIFAWQIDFFGIQKGDWYKVLYDQACVDDSVEVEISQIKGAVFCHDGKKYYAIPFMQDSVMEYFDEQGESLRKAFLKAPLKFSRISSRFTNARRHPILKITRPHHGVDYAAPSGTPVVSIGAGTVIKKAFQGGGGGNYLVIRHNSLYTTSYMHLSRFAKGISIGKRVQQGELIGYVGSTGLSSGPHLDFRVFKGGTPVNPLTIESPSGQPVNPAVRDSFLLVRRQIIADLDSISMIANNGTGGSLPLKKGIGRH